MSNDTRQQGQSAATAKIIELESGPDGAFDQLDERLDNPPKVWAPRGVPEGVDADECVTEKSVRGMVEETDLRSGDYGDYPVITLVLRDRSRVNVFGLGTVLKGRLGKVRVGDAVGISYLGTKPSSTPGMKDYDNYDVVVLRDGRPVSQAQVLGEYDEPVQDEDMGDLPMEPPS